MKKVFLDTPVDWAVLECLAHPSAQSLTGKLTLRIRETKIRALRYSRFDVRVRKKNFEVKSVKITKEWWTLVVRVDGGEC